MMNIAIFINIVASLVVMIATIVIARATVSYARISGRTLSGMKVYLKLMVKQASIIQNQFISASHILTESQKKESYCQAQDINNEILKEIESI